MSISSVDSAASLGAMQPEPTAVVGKASPVKDPIVSTGIPASAAPVHAPVSDKDVSKAIDALQNSSAFRDSDLSFSLDKESGITVVKVTDSKTDEVIRQIPTPEALALTHSIDETLRGNLIDQKV